MARRRRERFDSIEYLTEKIINLGDEFEWAGFDMISARCYRKEEKIECKVIFKEIQR